MSHHTSLCCTVPLASQAHQPLQDLSKGRGGARQRRGRWGRQTSLTPFRLHSLLRPSAQAGLGCKGHWGRNSRHPAGHVLALGACQLGGLAGLPTAAASPGTAPP